MATNWRHSAITVVLALGLGLVSSFASAQIPVTAAWDPSTDGLTVGYRVYVGVTPGRPAAEIDAGTATSVVLPLPPSGVYYVTVRGYSAAGVLGPPSTEAVVDLASAPGPPVGLRASVSGATASLSWSPPVSGGVAQRYVLSVGTTHGASNLLNDYPVGGVLAVSGALPPGTYFARLHAGNLVGIGPPSAEVSFQVGGATPPGRPRALAASVAGSAVTLSWSAPSDGADSYLVEAGTRSGLADVGALAVAGTTYGAIAPPGTYFVRVRAVRGSSISQPSDEIVVQVRP